MTYFNTLYTTSQTTLDGDYVYITTNSAATTSVIATTLGVEDFIL